MDSSLPLEPHALDQVLRSILELHPNAGMCAVGADGLFVPMPDSVPRGDRPVFEGRWALDLVGPADRVTVIETWERAKAKGAAHDQVSLTGDTPFPVDFYFIDARQSHGVYLGLAVPIDPTTGLAVPAPAPMPVRVAKIYKDQLSVITAIDAAGTQVLGWRGEDIVGRRSLELIHPDDHERAIVNWLEMLDDPGTPRPVRLRHQRRDSSWVWVEITNHYDGDSRSVMADVVDISDEMAAQETLREREQLLDRLAETVPLGLFQVDGRRRIVYANERLAAIIATSAGPTVADRFAHLVSGDRHVLDQALTGVLVDGNHAEIEVCLEPGSGAGSRHCALSIRPLTNAEGEVSGAIASVADVTESVRLRRELEHRATFDSLTGCHHRASLMAHLDEALASPGHTDAGTAVVFVDLDRFKPINDRHGHASGDRFLEIAAARLRASVRDHDIVGRFGGDEFLVVCAEVSDPSEALRVAGRIAAALHQQVSLPVGTFDMRASLGVAWSREAGRTAGDLVAEADTAMYESKRQSAGRPVLYGSSLSPVAASGLEDERWLRDALANDLLEVHYQPIVDLVTGATIGYESLIRAPRDGRLVAAGEFIEMAERTGLIHEIGTLVCERTLAQIARLGPDADDLYWAINASSLEIAAPGFTDAIERALDRHGVDPGRLVIEVTEHSSLGDSDQARAALQRLHEVGVVLALDDFGTGFSSLALLRTLPVSIVKIDRSFTAAVTDDTRSRQLVDATIEMARRLGLSTVIEGVETEEQRQLLAGLGATRAQGWLFAPALPPAELFPEPAPSRPTGPA